MNGDILTLKFVNSKNCFLHLPQHIYENIVGPSVCGLKVITSTGKDLYFSAKPVSNKSLKSDCVGISYKYAKTLELQENEGVIIVPIYNIGSIQTVNVTPVSEDDFEIVQSSSLEVERSLLNQLRIVWCKQVFPAWISKNVTVNLVVDSVVPNLKYGRLEEYTEVVVSHIIPKDSSSESCEAQITSNVTVLREKIPTCNVLKFRCVPLKTAFSSDNLFTLHPFVVFASSRNLPEWAKNVIRGGKRRSIWKLKKCNDDAAFCVVNLNVLDAEDFVETEVQSFKNLFVSYSVKQQLGIDVGFKLSLELLETEIIKITGILLSPTFEIKDEDKIIPEIQDLFTEAIKQHGDLLLNSKAVYPLYQGNVVITLRPLQADWGFISSSEISDLTINVNEFKPFNDQSNFNQYDSQVECDIAFQSYEELIEQGKLAIKLSLIFDVSRNNRFSYNVIYVGKSGTGKTSIVNFLFQKLRCSPFFLHTKSINCCLLKGKRIETLTKYVTEILNICVTHEPSVLFIENLNVLSASLEDHSEPAFHNIRITNKLAELIESYQAKHFFAIVATTKTLDNINPKFLSAKGKSLFSTVINIPDLTKEDHFQFLKQITSKISGCQLSDEDLHEVIANCEGYTLLDMKKLTERAVFEAWQRKAQLFEEFLLNADDFKSALEDGKAASVEQANLYKGVKKCWLNVGGLEDVKEKLMEVVCWSSKYPQIMSQCPVKPQTGILLYGAPGTGKTLIASALAGESHMNFISIKGPELMSKYIGESEEGVRKLFERAQAAKPCLLFFDEFDSLAPRRGQDQTGVTDRVVNQLLTALDGVDPVSGVWVIAATSRPDLIDPAILRPGRIGISVRCSLPDQDARLAILKVLCKKVSLSEEVDLEEIASLTDGFTGADLRGILTSAQIKAVDSLQDNGYNFSEDTLPQKEIKCLELSKDVLMMALNEVQPSLSPRDKMRYDAIYENFEKKTPLDLTQQKVIHA